MRKLFSCVLALPLFGIQAAHKSAALCGALSLVAGVTRWAHGKVLMSQEAALQKAFPGAERIERKTLYLEPGQIKDLERRAKTRLDSSVITYYQGVQSGRLLGTAFFDTRTVRTMPMTLMTVLNAEGTVSFVEILAFHEPEDYLPRPLWLKRFDRLGRTDRIRLRQDIPNVTGATLTCQTITDAVRLQTVIHDSLR